MESQQGQMSTNKYKKLYINLLTLLIRGSQVQVLKGEPDNQPLTSIL